MLRSARVVQVRVQADDVIFPLVGHDALIASDGEVTTAHFAGSKEHSGLTRSLADDLSTQASTADAVSSFGHGERCEMNALPTKRALLVKPCIYRWRDRLSGYHGVHVDLLLVLLLAVMSKAKMGVYLMLRWELIRNLLNEGGSGGWVQCPGIPDMG